MIRFGQSHSGDSAGNGRQRLNGSHIDGSCPNHAVAQCGSESNFIDRFATPHIHKNCCLFHVCKKRLVDDFFCLGRGRQNRQYDIGLWHHLCHIGHSNDRVTVALTGTGRHANHRGTQSL